MKLMDISQQHLIQLKSHLRVEGDEEDSLIIAYAMAAVDYAEKYCDGILVESFSTPPDGCEPPREIILSPAIWAAILLLVGHWYNNREASGQALTEIPFGVDDLLFLNRKWN